MFTGLVQDLGRIAEVGRRDEAIVLRIEPSRMAAATLVIGESVAIDGVCLTVTSRDEAGFEVLAGPETLMRTSLGGLTVGTRVNLERALLPTDRLGGHIVAGHVDGVGEVRERTEVGPALDVVIATPAPLLRYVVEKGSIAVDGISLTVNRVDATSFAVGLIPHTRVETTLGDKGIGSRVNLEVDMLAKYVEKLLGERVPSADPEKVRT